MPHNRLLQLAQSLGDDATRSADTFDDVAIFAALVFRLLWTERAGNWLIASGGALVVLGLLSYFL